MHRLHRVRAGVPVRRDRHGRDRARRADVQEGLQGAAREEERAAVRSRHAARRARPPDREQVRPLHRVRRSGVRVGVPDRLADRDQRLRPVPRALADDGAARAHRLRRTTSTKKRPQGGPAGDAVHRGPRGALGRPREGQARPLRAAAVLAGRHLRVPGRARRGRCCALYAPTMSYQFTQLARDARLRRTCRSRRSSSSVDVPRRRSSCRSTAASSAPA